jgi:hypothetical protein
MSDGYFSDDHTLVTLLREGRAWLAPGVRDAGVSTPACVSARLNSWAGLTPSSATFNLSPL